MAHQDMLVNYVRGEECRIAIAEGGKLEEFYSERASADLHVGNIYRGRVTNVEPAIQAAFIDFGLDRAGFLHVTDLHPRYFPKDKREEMERVGHKTPRRERPPIQQCLRRGQEILVQVLKEGIGGKGPTVTSYLSIPGRFLVMMPYMERYGVSRKIEDPEKRRQMQKLLDELDPPDGFGFIVRTAGTERNKTELKRDMAFLMRLWRNMEQRMSQGKGAAELYVESDLMTRTLRDVVTADVQRIIVDDREMALRAKHFLRLAMPRSSVKVYYYHHQLPLFDAFDIERQIQSIHDRVVPLESGGSLVFDSTEALVAIDVNSGKSRESSDAETNAYRTNLEAVDEIARQLRLRDLGGLVVLDLIDMYQLKHRRAVEKRLRDHLKKDRARTKDLRISELGILELTRQRMRPSLRKSVFTECPTCHGAGLVLSMESVVLDVIRRLGVALHNPKVQRVEIRASAEVLAVLFNRRRDALIQMERHSEKRIVFTVDHAAGPDSVTLTCFDEQSAPIDLTRLPKAKAPALTNADEIAVADIKELDDLLERAEAEAEEAEAKAEKASKIQAAEETQGDAEPGAKTSKRRRRRRRRSKRATSGETPASATEEEQVDDEELTADRPAADAETQPPAEAPANGSTSEGRRRRRRRGGRRRRRGRAATADQAASTADNGAARIESSGYEAGPAVRTASEEGEAA